MKKNLINLYTEIDKIFSSEPTVDQKAWGVINEFYHLILTYMERNKMSQAELARRLNKSRSAVSQMFSKTPNVSIKKMVEIANAVGIDINIISKEIVDYQPVSSQVKFRTEYIFVPLHPYIMDFALVNLASTKRYKKEEYASASLCIEGKKEFEYHL